MTDLINQILARWSDYFTSGTIAANLTLAGLVIVGIIWLAAVVPAPRGPVITCPCGWHDRQRERETRRTFERRQSDHFDACPAVRPHH